MLRIMWEASGGMEREEALGLRLPAGTPQALAGSAWYHHVGALEPTGGLRLPGEAWRVSCG